MQVTVKDNNIRKVNSAKAIMRAESQRKGWNAIKEGIRQKRTPAPMMVETIDTKGKRVQCTTQELVEAAIHGEISP